MYYEERIIDNVLMFRNSPNQNFRPLISNKADIINKLLLMEPEIRQDIVSYFCHYCGKLTPCYCSNDD